MPEISCNNPALGYVGIAYSHSFVASDGVEPYVYAIIAGDLPDGLTLNEDTGVVSGIPSTKGTFTFTIEVTDDDAETAEVECSIRIVGACLLTGATPVPIE